MDLLWYVVLACGTGIVAAMIAERKGRTVFGWFMVGLLLNLLGVLLAVVVRPVEYVGVTQKCPQCAEIVKWEAVKCRDCGTPLQRLT